MAEAAESTEAAEVVETPAPPAEKFLPQSEVDRVIQERLARQAKDQPSKDELAELRAAKVRLEELEQAGASELDKANKAKEKAEADSLKIKAQAEQMLVQASATAELAKQGVTNIDGALRALDKTGLTVGDDGTVSGVSEAVTALLEAIPEFVGKVVPIKVDQGARSGGSGPEQVSAAQLESMSVEEIVKATAEGRLTDLLV